MAGEWNTAGVYTANQGVNRSVTKVPVPYALLKTGKLKPYSIRIRILFGFPICDNENVQWRTGIKSANSKTNRFPPFQPTKTSVTDPDPYVFGTPGSGSISTTNGSGS